jgi:YHS domain-containing protein
VTFPLVSRVGGTRDTPPGYILLSNNVTKEDVVVVDPVCGMQVSPEDAAAAWQHAATTHYFCSVGCMERFREDPERFLSGDPAGRST